MTWRPTDSHDLAISPSPAATNVSPIIRPGNEPRNGIDATHDEGGTTDVTRLADATMTDPTTPRTNGERTAGRYPRRATPR